MRAIIKLTLLSIALAIICSIMIAGCPRIGEIMVERDYQQLQKQFDDDLQKSIDNGQVVMEIDQKTGKVTYRNSAAAGRGEGDAARVLEP